MAELITKTAPVVVSGATAITTAAQSHGQQELILGPAKGLGRNVRAHHMPFILPRVNENWQGNHVQMQRGIPPKELWETAWTLHPKNWEWEPAVSASEPTAAAPPSTKSRAMGEYTYMGCGTEEH